MSAIEERLGEITENIKEAAKRSGRSPMDVSLIAVSKTYSVDRIREVLDAGQRVFGENRVQEALSKAPLLPGNVSWHLIGHLQSNKIRKALGLFDLFHGIDSLELAKNVDRIASEVGTFPRILLEVNVSGEATKFGFVPERLEAALEDLLPLRRIQIEGLMTMPPLTADPERSRPFFVKLRELRDHLAQRTKAPFPVLSMGMSGDYQVAVEEGATLVRVGTALFGSRIKVK